jgi:hypothetical protein
VIWSNSSVSSKRFVYEADVGRAHDKLINLYVPDFDLRRLPHHFQKYTVAPVTAHARVLYALAALELEKKKPKVPSQTTAPVECNWRAERLRMLKHPPESPDESGQDGRAANYKHLKSECDRLRNEFVGNNAARRVCDLLDRYAQALADAFDRLDIFRLGHAGIALRAAANGAREILSDASNAELAGLLTSHELFVRQDPKWNKYVETATRANFDRERFEKHAKTAERITELLASFYPVVDQDIPNFLRELRQDVADAILQASLQCYGHWKSIENVMLALVEKALEFASKEADAFSKIFLEASGKFADDMADEVRQQLIKIGGAAVATAIVAACGYGLAEIAGYSDTLFSWFKAAKDFLETIAKARR